LYLVQGNKCDLKAKMNLNRKLEEDFCFLFQCHIVNNEHFVVLRIPFVNEFLFSFFFLYITDIKRLCKYALLTCLNDYAFKGIKLYENV
jgi:hypothetical protein